MLEQIAAFLLEIPPLDEIGGKITHLIEQYRTGTIEKEVAIKSMLKDYVKFLEHYMETNKQLNL